MEHIIEVRDKVAALQKKCDEREMTYTHAPQ